MSNYLLIAVCVLDYRDGSDTHSMCGLERFMSGWAAATCWLGGGCTPTKRRWRGRQGGPVWSPYTPGQQYSHPPGIHHHLPHSLAQPATKLYILW